jgi:hypothetical protein
MPQPRWQDPDPRSRYRDDWEAYPDPPLETRNRRPPHERAAWRLGSLPGRAGILFIAGAAALGTLATIAAGNGPGVLLGAFLVAGTLAAALTVHPRAVYLLIPVPALAYPVAAIIAGLAAGHPAGTSHTALAVGAAQWAASGFIAMTAATVLAIGITAARWPRRRPGHPHPPGYRPPAAGTGRPGRFSGRSRQRGWRR